MGPSESPAGVLNEQTVTFKHPYQVFAGFQALFNERNEVLSLSAIQFDCATKGEDGLPIHWNDIDFD